MIAVVKVGGQQYKVEKDQTLYVPHIEGNAGDKVDLEVLLADADGKLQASGASRIRLAQIRDSDNHRVEAELDSVTLNGTPGHAELGARL